MNNLRQNPALLSLRRAISTITGNARHKLITCLNNVSAFFQSIATNLRQPAKEYLVLPHKLLLETGFCSRKYRNF
jgi:hypothetical protein